MTVLFEGYNPQYSLFNLYALKAMVCMHYELCGKCLLCTDCTTLRILFFLYLVRGILTRRKRTIDSINTVRNMFISKFYGYIPVNMIS
jgi:hypothetical protein